MSRGAGQDGGAARAAAARAVAAVLTGRALDEALPEHSAALADNDRALAQELAYGVARWHPRLDALAGRLLRRPLRGREAVVHALILVGLYQLGHLRTAPHGAVDGTVAAARVLGRPWATGLVNGVLRRYQRERADLEAAVDARPAARHAHPEWLLERLAADWPEDWPAVVAANNTRPPMTLRVNTRQGGRDAYAAELAAAGVDAAPVPAAPEALVLAQPVPVARLPGFADGRASVQDAGAQLAAGLLDAGPGMRVLDACAAPGGKTAHILERCPDARVTALDLDAARLERVRENLARLGLEAGLVAADAAVPAAWWDGRPYERILLDAPCSATGVIRRHPDIKLLRRPGDVAALAGRQAALLRGLWPLLAPGGMLLYATCSVLRQENAGAVEVFLQAHPEARARPVAASWGRPLGHGRQLLPGEGGMDGFFYACLIKSP